MSEQVAYEVVLAHVAHQVNQAPAMATAEAAFLDAWRAAYPLLRSIGHDELAFDLQAAFEAAIAEAVRETLRAALHFDGGALLWSAARRAAITTLCTEQREPLRHALEPRSS